MQTRYAVIQVYGFEADGNCKYEMKEDGFFTKTEAENRLAWYRWKFPSYTWAVTTYQTYIP